jgi:hypothetical protein
LRRSIPLAISRDGEFAAVDAGINVLLEPVVQFLAQRVDAIAIARLSEKVDAFSRVLRKILEFVCERLVTPDEFPFLRANTHQPIFIEHENALSSHTGLASEQRR